MSCQASFTTPRLPSSLRRNRANQAPPVSRANGSAEDTTTNEKVLARLEAIYTAVQQAPSLDQAVRLPEVLAIVGISKSTWYARLNPHSPSHDPRVPRPFKLGTTQRSPSAWWRSAVMAYVTACANTQVSGGVA